MRNFLRCALLIAFMPTLLCTAARAGDLKRLDDSALSDVRGRDGVSFAVNLNTAIGSVTLGTSDSAANAATLALNNVIATGTVASTLDVLSGGSTGPNYISFAFPNLSGANTLQYGFDLAVTDNGTTFGTGVQLHNLAFGGTNFQMTPYATGGVTFGMGLNLGIGDVLLQPNGRGNTVGQMDINGLTISASGSNGTAPWQLANINTQPGLFNVVTDANGTTTLQWGIGWASTPGTAPAGSLQINNITFTTPDGNVNLGSSSIGSMQIQYLNVRLKP